MQMYANYLRSRRAARRRRRRHQPPETMRRSSPAVKLEQFHVYYVLDGSKDFQRVVKESAPRHKYLINTRDGRLIGGARQSLALLYFDWCTHGANHWSVTPTFPSRSLEAHLSRVPIPLPLRANKTTENKQCQRAERDRSERTSLLQRATAVAATFQRP